MTKSRNNNRIFSADILCFFFYNRFFCTKIRQNKPFIQRVIMPASS